MSRRAARRGFAVALAAALLLGVGGADAYQNPARTLAGPAGVVVDLGDAAMAADGSGGVVFRMRVDGHAHVFVAQLVDGRWGAAQQVDRGQRFDSSWPRLAAATGGRLVATWVQENGADADRLFAARLNTDSSGWDAPVVVDPNVGESVATDPSIALGPDGSALIAYLARVPVPANPDGTPGTPPTAGFAQTEIRLARLRGDGATSFPPLNRDLSRPLPDPQDGDGPRVAIDGAGSGIVAWQEPDDRNVPRIYARRVGRGGVGTQRQVSPAVVGGLPLPAAVQGFDLALTGDGEAAIAFRQLPIAASAVASERVLLSRLRAPAPGRDASSFSDPVAADGLGALSRAGLAAPGLPDVGVADDGAIGVALADGGQVLLGFADDGGTPVPARAAALAPGLAPPALAVGRAGASVAAWGSDAAGGSVVVAERPAGGASALGRASALLPGPVDRVLVGGSGGGDAIVAFQQGRGEQTQIGATVVDGPPEAFAIDDPKKWLRTRDAQASWGRALAAGGPVTYRLYVDGRRTGPPTTSSSAPLGAALDDGAHRLLVIAADRHGQETRSAPRIVEVDGTAPAVRFTQRGRTLDVLVTDGVADHASGVDGDATTIAFGDGARAAGATASHRYRHLGTVRVTVTAVDHAGNRRTVVRRVEVRP